MEYNCLVAQSGGPTAVINASVCGVVQYAINCEKIDKVYGALYGIEGFLDGKVIDFNDLGKDEIEALKYTPSSALGSCRYKLCEYNEDKDVYIKIFESLKRLNVKYFFYIGGNDSMDTVDKLSRYSSVKGYDIKIIGIPKTIDNDLYGTDHTPGFGSAAKYIAASVEEIARDGYVYNKDIVNIVEVMGRNTGWLAASSVIASLNDDIAPQLIYLPEVPFETEKFINDVKRAFSTNRKLTIVTSEGIKYGSGEFVQDTVDKASDCFGHKIMGGAGLHLGNIVKKNICKRVKVIEFNVLQRCAAHFISKTDINEAYMCGHDAVRYAMKGESGKMVSIIRDSNNPYISHTSLVPVSDTANKEKKFPMNWISKEGNFVNDEAIQYFKPLIEGEVGIPYKNGIPCYTKIINRF
jgi:ATP-dependent phosphofructokinase / diphosphate-dependent phosphofructokinase